MAMAFDAFEIVNGEKDLAELESDLIFNSLLRH